MNRLIAAAWLFLLFQPGWSYSAENSNNPYKTVATELTKAYSGKDKAVAVAGFTYADGRDSLDGGIVVDRLTTELVKLNKFRVIERKEIEKVLGELKLQRSGAIDQNSVKDIGKLLGAEWIVVGTLARLTDAKIELNARLVQVESGAILAASNAILSKDWQEQYRQVISAQNKAIEKKGKEPQKVLPKGATVDSGDAQLFYERGVAYTDLGEYDNALASFGIAIDMDPAYAKAYHGRGYAHYLSSNYAKAIEDFSKVISISPRDAEAYFRRGFVYVLNKDYVKAVEDYSKAIAISPELSVLYASRGEVYLQRGDTEKALKDYSKAVDVDPANADAYYLRAKLLSKKGMFDKAVADYEQAVKLDSKYFAREYKIQVPTKETCYAYECVAAMSENDFKAALSSMPAADKDRLVSQAKKKVRACFADRSEKNIVVPPEINLWDGEERFLEYLCKSGLLGV